MRFLKRSLLTSSPRHRPAFTLIELLLVIAILSIVAAAVIVAVNPAKRSRQARDAARKQHINNIANALIGYYTLVGRYPIGWQCSSSRGTSPISNACPFGIPQNNWGSFSNTIRANLVTDQGFLKELPLDPINSDTPKNYYYLYRAGSDLSSPCDNSSLICNYYWIGALLEEPENQNRPIFRCSDFPGLTSGPGCKEVGAPSPPYDSFMTGPGLVAAGLPTD